MTVAADPASETWEAQVHCARCGPSCEVLTREFRIGLLADRLHWYHKIAQQLCAGILISSDKNFDKIIAHDPLLRLDAVVLFKSPRKAAFSHFRHRRRKGYPEAPGSEVSKYLTKWARSYETFLDRFDVRGKRVFLSWDRFCQDPLGHLEGLCAMLGLPFDSRVLERIDPDQHCLGGNRMVNQHFRQSASFRVQQSSRPTLAAEHEEAVERHDGSRGVHGRLFDMHRGAFGTEEL